MCICVYTQILYQAGEVFQILVPRTSSERNAGQCCRAHMDADGNVCAITFEHASQRTDVDHLTVEGIAA